ncbi:MAG: formylmethanofuran dehydrogenase subunit B [Candidatus Hodarchaeota archaeon]
MKIIKDVICVGCGLLCDDIIATVKKGKIIHTYGTCLRGAELFKSVRGRNRIRRPSLKDKSRFKPVSLDRALKAAVEILYNAKKPFMYGWGTSSCEAQMMGIKLAEKLGGVIDGTASICHGFSLKIIEEELGKGFDPPTLNEILDEADLIVYWGSNPADSHSRHLSRYTAFPRGRLTQSGRESRNIILVDVRKTRTAKTANIFIQVSPDGDLKLIEGLSRYLSGNDLPKNLGGADPENVKGFANMIRSAQYGVIFMGLGVLQVGGEDTIRSLVRLTSQLNKNGKRFVLMPMIGHMNMMGIINNMKELTGFPYGADFSKKPVAHVTVTDVLSKRICDATLVVGSDPLGNLPHQMVKSLMDIPLIVIDPNNTLTAKHADVIIPVAITGIEAEGTVIGMDMTTKKLKRVADPPANCLTDEEVLRRLTNMI